jgi:hypothetical protein
MSEVDTFGQIRAHFLSSQWSVPFLRKKGASAPDRGFPAAAEDAVNDARQARREAVEDH